MKFSEDSSTRNRLITHYDAESITLDEQQYRHSIIVSDEHSPQRWEAGLSFTTLTTAALEPLLALKPEIILLGTGSRQYFMPPQLMHHILSAGIGCEVMSTAAACRTFNIIVGEGRHVAAGLIID
jgi:uncharacterized protein